MESNNKYIDELLKLSKKAEKKGNVPIAAIIIKDGKIISKAYNKKNTTNIAVDHAEILAIQKACRKLHSWRLDECMIIVTLEPCKMCYAAIAEARIKKILFILDSNYNDVTNSNLNKISISKMNDDGKYKKILNDFFKNRR